VLADVPEARQGQVKVGQGCQATFFGLPNRRFAGKVLRIAPALSKERRSLRVLFTIDDLKDELRPGMFAEIGLGTDPREALLVPADGVLHVGRADYVLVGTEANTWQVADVQVGEPHNGDVEVLDGLKPVDRLIGKGAILFKPLIVRALLPAAPVAPAGRPMIARLIETAMRLRWLVLGLTVAVLAAGVYSFRQQPIDAYPDISSQMVQVITTFPGRAPEEVERQVTVPIEIAMRNVPKVEVVRSRTIFGLSVVQMIFEEGTDGYWARQRVQEKVAGLTLPVGAKADFGPLATAYGEVCRYELAGDGTFDQMELRTLNDWVVIPKLLRAAGWPTCPTSAASRSSSR